MFNFKPNVGMDGCMYERERERYTVVLEKGGGHRAENVSTLKKKIHTSTKLYCCGKQMK